MEVLMRSFPLAPFVLSCLVAGAPAAAQTVTAAGAEPHWLKQPSTADMAAVYPRVGARLGHYGRVTLNCAVQPDGSLAHCEVVSEDPGDEGFGDAALKLSRLYRMAPPERSPLPRPTIDVPVRFSLAP
jgi:protein TonB